MQYCWTSIWNSLTPTCQKAVCTIDLPSFKEKIDEYLVRHSFCNECKAQIYAAYNYLTSSDRPLAGKIMNEAADRIEKSVEERIKEKIKIKMKSTQRKIIKQVGINTVQSLLSGDKKKDFSDSEDSENETSQCTLDGSESESYDSDSDENQNPLDHHTNCTEECHSKCTCFEWNPVLFSGIKFHQKDQSLKITSHDQHIIALLKKAESEMISNMLSGGSHARHAKTNIQAQNEIIIVAGIFLYERLHKIWLKISEVSLAGKFLALIFCENMKVKYEELFDRKVGKNACIDEIMKFMEGVDGDDKNKTAVTKKRKRTNKKNSKVTTKIKAVDCSVKIESTGFKIACKHDHEHEHHGHDENNNEILLESSCIDEAESQEVETDYKKSNNKYDILNNLPMPIEEEEEKPLPEKKLVESKQEFECEYDAQLAIWIEERRQQLLEIDTKALHDKIKCRYLNCEMCKKIDGMKITGAEI